MTEYVQELYKDEGDSNNHDENNDSKPAILNEEQIASSDNVLEPLKVLENQKQIDDRKENESFIEQRKGNGTYRILEGSTNAVNISFTLPNYNYTKEDIEKFFASDNGQKEVHTLEESICAPLIGKQNNLPFFYYCKLDPKVENIYLKSINDHIRFKDPERHKAKLLELLDKEEEEKKVTKSNDQTAENLFIFF